MINDCGQFQICNIDDRCIILEIVKFLHFYFYLQYTSDRQHGREYAQAGVSVGTVDRPGGGGGGGGGGRGGVQSALIFLSGTVAFFDLYFRH